MPHYLCEELIGEIHGRLPPKLLVRFRSVSKSWYSHISSFGFIRKHTLLFAKTPQKFILRQRIRYTKDSFDPLNTLHREKGVKISMDNITIYGSCNGIVCLVEKKQNCYISLWNLSIGRKLSVPEPPYGINVPGFGFDPVTDDYKINHLMTHYVCEELIDEIIERLPPKSLSVSKSWYSRISSADFIRKQALRSAKTSQKAIFRERIHYRKDGIKALRTLYRENRVEISMNNFHIYGLCNGILCLVEKEHKRFISLWNLSIGRKLSVPNPPYGLKVLKVVGFGFDPITNDYKIVSISFPDDEGIAHKSLMYSMKTNSWSEIAFRTTMYSHVKTSSITCLVNGALHWMVKYDPDNMVRCHIMKFDLSTNVFSKIPLPQLQLNCEPLHLTIVKGFLAFISTNDRNIWIQVWRENDNVASWSKAFNLTSLQFEGVDTVVCFKSFAKDFKTYNHETGILSTFEMFSDYSYIVYKHMCVESLELLHGDLLEQP